MKILIIRLSSLGDIILTQPVVAWLQKTYPEAELHFLVKRQFAELPAFFLASPANELANQENKPGLQACKVVIYQKTLGFHLSLTQSEYDIVIDLQDKLSSWLIRMFTPQARHFTYKKQHLLRRSIVKHQTDRTISSTLEMYFSALEELTRQHIEINKAHFPRLHLSREHRPNVSDYLSSMAGKKLIALFPGANHSTKRYPAQLFIRLIELIPDNFGILLLGSKNERELCNQINQIYPHKTVNLAGELTLDKLIYLIDKMDIVISNDSGPMHIAAALAKRQIALFGATHPKLGFAPLNEKATVICKNLACQPCSLHGQEECPLKHFACMMSIKPEEIFKAMQKPETA